MNSDFPNIGQISFHAHLALLQLFVSRRNEIVDSIQQLLNAHKKTLQYQQNTSVLTLHFKDCFYLLKGITHEQACLRDQLETAHWANGFKPRNTPGNDLVDPAEMMVRGFHFWRQTRWPGNKGRIRYAHTLFNLYLIRCITLLLMRLWDEDLSEVSARLALVQAVLDQLWLGAPDDQPVLVRDARWLIPVAISPTTDDLKGYFPLTAKIAQYFSEAELIETQRASIVLGAGHLRSQLLHVSMQQGLTIDDIALVLDTRKSNALDIALMIQGLVPLLKAYDRSITSNDSSRRLVLAHAICQGVSPDPELFLNRLGLLGPYSMIEHLFISTDSSGTATYTAMGQRHLELLQHYEALIKNLSHFLLLDCQQFRPLDGSYSPFGVLFGFSSNLIELMAFKTLELEAPIDFSMEDIFADGDEAKLAWVVGWRKLPHIKPEILKQFEYPRQFAQDIFARIEQALNTAVCGKEDKPVGRLYIFSEDEPQALSKAPQIPVLASRYIVSSAPQLVAANKAVLMDQQDLLACRLEGEFVVSYEVSGAWVGISKDFLTEISGTGQDVKIDGLPRESAAILRLMCPNLLVSAGH